MLQRPAQLETCWRSLRLFSSGRILRIQSWKRGASSEMASCKIFVWSFIFGQLHLEFWHGRNTFSSRNGTSTTITISKFGSVEHQLPSSCSAHIDHVAGITVNSRRISKRTNTHRTKVVLMADCFWVRCENWCVLWLPPFTFFQFFKWNCNEDSLIIMLQFRNCCGTWICSSGKFA